MASRWQIADSVYGLATGASDRVRAMVKKRSAEVVAAGYGAVLDVDDYAARPSKPAHHVVHVWAGDRVVTVSVSPAGRNVRVWVDNEEVPRGR